MFVFQGSKFKEFTTQNFRDMVTSSLLDQLGSTPAWNFGWDGNGNTTIINVNTPVTNMETLNKVAKTVNEQLHAQYKDMPSAPASWGIKFESCGNGTASFSVSYEVPSLFPPGTTGGVSSQSEVYKIPSIEFGESLASNLTLQTRDKKYEAGVVAKFETARKKLDAWIRGFEQKDATKPAIFGADIYEINAKDFWDEVKIAMGSGLNLNQRKFFAELVATTLGSALRQHVSAPDRVWAD